MVEVLINSRKLFQLLPPFAKYKPNPLIRFVTPGLSLVSTNIEQTLEVHKVKICTQFSHQPSKYAPNFHNTRGCSGAQLSFCSWLRDNWTLFRRLPTRGGQPEVGSEVMRSGLYLTIKKRRRNFMLLPGGQFWFLHKNWRRRWDGIRWLLISFCPRPAAQPPYSRGQAKKVVRKYS